MAEVDLKLPNRLYDESTEFPPAPESLAPKIEYFSAPQKSEPNGRINEEHTMGPTR